VVFLAFFRTRTCMFFFRFPKKFLWFLCTSNATNYIDAKKTKFFCCHWNWCPLANIGKVSNFMPQGAKKGSEQSHGHRFRFTCSGGGEGGGATSTPAKNRDLHYFFSFSRLHIYVNRRLPFIYGLLSSNFSTVCKSREVVYLKVNSSKDCTPSSHLYHEPVSCYEDTGKKIIQ
jgi:hypothetical protein